MTKPYTVRLFVPDGEPENLLIVNKMNWTGVGLRISRKYWELHRKRPELDRPGVYILSGYSEGDELPTLYIGQADSIRGRIDSHSKNKEFWDKAIAFTTSNDSLNRAHITWLEWALIQKAHAIKRCIVENSVQPSEPAMIESEKADTQQFLNELLSALPLIDVPYFVHPEIIMVEKRQYQPQAQDTVIVPAQEEGFQDVFLKKNCWYSIRIGGGMLDKIRYIAAYRTAPISAITHYAEVSSIEPYGDGGKYKLNFKDKAIEISHVPFGDAKTGSMQGPRYTSLEKLKSARKLSELI